MTKKTFTCFMLLNFMTFAYAQYPVINTNRPRIYADSTRLSWLQSNILIPGDCQTTFTNIQTAYNGWWINDPQLYLLGSDSTQWTWDWNSQWADDQAQLSLLIYKLTSSPLELMRCRFIARQVIHTINTTNFSVMAWFPKEELLRKMSTCGDLFLDWCYTNFPETLRDSLTQSLYVMNREFMNTYIYSGAGTSYVSSHNTWNTVYCNQNALVLHQASGLSVLQQDTVALWHHAIYEKLINGFIPCWTYYRDDDGGWNWGAAYSMWSLTDQFQLFENMRVGTNKNFYTDLPWVRNSINQYIYFIQPNEKSIHLGDGETRIIPDRVMYLHARLFNDPRSLWMAQYYSQPAFTGNTMDKYTKLLYKDFTMPAVTQPGHPLNWWADKVGLSVSRSSWNDNSTMVTFFNSPSKRAAHEHRDNNSFTLFKNKPLLIDAGYYDTYGGSHYTNYYQRTIAHNSICVYDSTDIYTCFGNPASNDGGQIESAALQNYSDIFLPQNQRGKWIQYASGYNYTYQVADAQLSYDSNKLNFFRRRLLYLIPDKVIVLDHVYLKNSSTKQRDIKWVGHFVNQPVMSGSIINTEVSGHIETYNGKDYTATNGNGNLAIRTLLPDSTTTTRIGGSGYEYWVAGANYPPLVTPDTSNYTPGGWRIEVRPRTITDTIVYLHTITIGDNVNRSVAGGISLHNNTSAGADWNDTLYFFSADAGTRKIYHYFNQINGGRTVGIFAADLSIGTYYVKVDGTIVSLINTDTNGILQTSISIPPGNHLIEILQVVTSVGNPFNANNTIRVYPNPVQTELNIVINTYFLKNEIEIYNSMGQLMLKTSDVQKLNVSHLSKGIYLIKVNCKGKYYVSKFIKD
ncbi:MAG TPA: T9SS type A sorting domain-containing protein [Chitinophagaceae bacterium]|nr:T9SS type A sorting domain-containing protein [Chitinophagaceae bacterium]